MRVPARINRAGTTAETNFEKSARERARVLPAGFPRASLGMAAGDRAEKTLWQGGQTSVKDNHWPTSSLLGAPWKKVWLAVALAWVAGFVDVTGYLTLIHIFTSHLSGNSVASPSILPERSSTSVETGGIFSDHGAAFMTSAY